jgi:hypothetical protein
VDLSFLPSRRMNHDAVLLGNCSNCVDSRHVCGAFAGGVEGSEHAIEAGARYREHQQVRRNSADIAIGVPSVARGKEKSARPRRKGSAAPSTSISTSPLST